VATLLPPYEIVGRPEFRNSLGGVLTNFVAVRADLYCLPNRTTRGEKNADRTVSRLGVRENRGIHNRSANSPGSRATSENNDSAVCFRRNKTAAGRERFVAIFSGNFRATTLPETV